MVGTLKFLIWGRPWILTTLEGTDIDLRQVFQNFFLNAKNRRLDAQTGQEKLILRLKQNSDLILDFEGMEKERLLARNVRSEVFLNLGILLEAILINLDGRRVVFETGPDKIGLSADPAQEIPRVSLFSSRDALDERFIKGYCRPEAGEDACIFFNPVRKGCEKFLTKQASQRLMILALGKTNGPRRIGNCGRETKTKPARAPGW